MTFPTTLTGEYEQQFCKYVLDEVVIYHCGSLDSIDWNDGYRDESWGKRAVIFNPFHVDRSLSDHLWFAHKDGRIPEEEYFTAALKIKAVVIDESARPYSVQYFTDKQAAYEAWFDLLAKHQPTFIKMLQEYGPDALPEIEHLIDFLPLLGKAYKKYMKKHPE